MGKLLIASDVLLLALSIWAFPRIPEQLPLLYSRPWGESQIVEYWYILLLPILMHLFYFLDAFVIEKFLTENQILKKILTYTMTVTILVYSAIFIKILFLVT